VGPSSSRSQAIDNFIFERFIEFVGVGNLKEVNHLLWYRHRQLLHRLIQLRISFLFVIESVPRRRIRPFTSSSLERVQAQSDVIFPSFSNVLDDVVHVEPSRGVTPAPVLVRQLEIVLGEEVAEK